MKEKTQEKLEDKWEMDKPEIFQKMYEQQQKELKKVQKGFRDI